MMKRLTSYVVLFTRKERSVEAEARMITKVVCDGWLIIFCKGQGELKLAESQVMCVIFAKDDQGSGLVSDCVLVSSFVEEICSVVSEDGKNSSWFQDPSERKLQRSMTVRFSLRGRGSDSCGCWGAQLAMIRGYKRIRIELVATRLDVVLRGFQSQDSSQAHWVKSKLSEEVLLSYSKRCYKFKSAGYVSGYGSSRFRNSSPRQVEVTAYTGWSKHIQFGGTEIAFEGAMTLVVSRVESCLYKCCSAHLQMFFGFRWSSATGSDEFLKSSQCIEGKENEVECVQENVKCSDIKAESEREKQFLGGAIFSKESCIIRVLSSRLRNKFLLKFSQSVSLQEGLVQQEKSHHEHEIDVKEAVKETVQVQVSRLSWLDRRLVESGLIKGGNKYVSGFCKRFSVVFLILISAACSVGDTRGAEWCSSQCVHSDGCKGNLMLRSGSLPAVEFAVTGQALCKLKLMECVELLMSGHLKFSGYGNCQRKINEEVEHNTRLERNLRRLVLMNYNVELRLRGSKEQWQDARICRELQKFSKVAQAQEESSRRDSSLKKIDDKELKGLTSSSSSSRRVMTRVTICNRIREETSLSSIGVSESSGGERELESVREREIIILLSLGDCNRDREEEDLL
uniref:Uncharacterized protein n=1 Tax=Brassica oleracea var. oleracea TaxID=109376 RepID=A0A0D3DAC7_BRAOL